MPNVTTSLPQEQFDLAKALNLKWNEALIRGIRELSNEEMPFDPNVKEENNTLQNKLMKLERQNRVMQEHITKLNEELGGKT